MTTKPALQTILKGILHRQDEATHSHETVGIINSQEMSSKVIRE
jgi:hypothetical protein